MLKQTSPHVKDGHIWIDAVCINQSNNDEKSEQVAKMGEVFKNAIQVFACVGEHKDDSEACYSIVKGDERYFRSWRSVILRKGYIYYPPIYYYPQVLFWKLKQSLKARNFGVARLRTAFKAFLARPYFHRVWIYQELFLAQEVTVICGHETMPISWIWMACLVLHVKILLRHKRRLILWSGLESEIRPQMTLLQAGSTSQGSMSLEEAMGQVRSLHCQDPRDRFYGTLSILDWYGREPIKPEYNKDRFDLAVEVLTHLDDQSSLTVLLIYAGQIKKMLELSSEPIRRQTESLHHRMFANLEAADAQLPWISNNLRDTTGITTCSLTGLRLSYHRGEWKFQENSKAKLITEIDQWKSESTTRKQQWTSNILLPPEARDGDWLLLSESNLDDAVHSLLARDLNDYSGRWELVGKVLMAVEKDSSRKWKRLVNNLDPVFKVFLDAQDVFCLLFSLRWRQCSLDIEPLDESTVTRYFETRLCRNRYSSFAVRKDANLPGNGS